MPESKFIVEIKKHNDVIVSYSTYYGIIFLSVNLSESKINFDNKAYSLYNISDILSIFEYEGYEKELLKLSNYFYNQRKSDIFVSLPQNDHYPSGNYCQYASQFLRAEAYFGKIIRNLKLKEILK